VLSIAAAATLGPLNFLQRPQDIGQIVAHVAAIAALPQKL
jgi:hypothetical protein